MSAERYLIGTNVANRLPNIERGSSFSITINGESYLAYPGESVAAVLMVSGIRSFSQKDDGETNNRLFCGMGVCHQCLVTIDGVMNLRACMTEGQPGMKVETKSISGDIHS
jgi:predicted molibdopterin-dependent oxidoreductase YjgC